MCLNISSSWTERVTIFREAIFTATPACNNWLDSKFFIAVLFSIIVNCWKENSVIFPNLCLIIFILGWLLNLRTMLSMVWRLFARLETFCLHFKKWNRYDFCKTTFKVITIFISLRISSFFSIRNILVSQAFQERFRSCLY